MLFGQGNTCSLPTEGGERKRSSKKNWWTIKYKKPATFSLHTPVNNFFFCPRCTQCKRLAGCTLPSLTWCSICVHMKALLSSDVPAFHPSCNCFHPCHLTASVLADSSGPWHCSALAWCSGKPILLCWGLKLLFELCWLDCPSWSCCGQMIIMRATLKICLTLKAISCCCSWYG